MWVGFVGLVLALLALDLGVFHRKRRIISPSRAACWSGIWILLSAAFGVGIALAHGTRVALEFASGYVLEKSLAIDNLFVIALLFAHFRVPRQEQHRVLYWGILGALLTRGAFIGLGTALIAKFSWVLYAFGALLVVAGVHVALKHENDNVDAEGFIVRLVRRVVPVTRRFETSSFWVIERRHWMATPLVLALVTIEVSDVVFAIDSIPAVFAVTRDPFIVFTSNICAVLGMRSLYFLLAHVIDRFHYLKFGLAAVLCFVGLRLLFAHLVEIPILVSLGVIVLLVSASIVVSWLVGRSRGPRRPHVPAPPSAAR
jgi:tellurite resistance protein TerC